MMNPDQQLPPQQPQSIPQPQAPYQPMQPNLGQAAPQPVALQPNPSSYAPGPSPTNEHNPYEFFLKSEQTKSSGGGLKDSFIKKLLVIVGGLIVLCIIGVIVAQLLSPKENSRDLYITLAQEQQEIIRVASQGTQATSETTRGFAITTQLSIGSDQTALTKYLANRNIKISTKTLVLKQSPATDTLLTNARATNTFDSALTKTLTTDLAAYMADLQKTYKVSSNPEAKKILNDCYTHAATLLKQ